MGCALLGLLLLISAGTARGQTAVTAEQAFERLSTLVGRWQANVGERMISVDIRLSAAGSALVETWTLSSSRESLTIYTRDGDRLLATHYCPQGNQPRLRFEGADAEGRYRFAFVDGGNLQDPQRQHQHALWTRFDDANQFTRSEIYLPNGATAEAAEVSEDLLVFRRVVSEPDASTATVGRH
jgi:hypothetical protein